MSLASVSPGYEYDQSGVTMAEVPALSSRSALPPKSALSALLTEPTVVALPEADSPPKQYAVPQA